MGENNMKILNCWTKFSPLTVCLILVLIVAIPYLVGLLIVVIYFGIPMSESATEKPVSLTIQPAGRSIVSTQPIYGHRHSYWQDDYDEDVNAFLPKPEKARIGTRSAPNIDLNFEAKFELKHEANPKLKANQIFKGPRRRKLKRISTTTSTTRIHSKTTISTTQESTSISSNTSINKYNDTTAIETASIILNSITNPTIVDINTNTHIATNNFTANDDISGVIASNSTNFSTDIAPNDDVTSISTIGNSSGITIGKDVTAGNISVIISNTTIEIKNLTGPSKESMNIISDFSQIVSGHKDIIDETKELKPDTVLTTTSTDEEQNQEFIISEVRRKRENILECPTCPPVKTNSICPPLAETADYPYIAALNEITFVDAPTDDEFRHKCAGVIINQHLFLTSSECINENTRKSEYYQIRAGTKYWSSQTASIHAVEKPHYKNAGNRLLTLLKVVIPFPSIKTIQYVNVSNEDTSSFNSYDAISWDYSAILPLNLRLRNSKVKQYSIKKVPCKWCREVNVICANEATSYCSNYYSTSGIPLFINNRLIGMSISSHCDQPNNILERCYIAISEYANWIETMKTKYSS